MLEFRFGKCCSKNTSKIRKSMKIFRNTKDYIIINTAFDSFVTKKSINYKKL
jgi:hypothetical protein